MFAFFSAVLMAVPMLGLMPLRHQRPPSPPPDHDEVARLLEEDRVWELSAEYWTNAWLDEVRGVAGVPMQFLRRELSLALPPVLTPDDLGWVVERLALDESQTAIVAGLIEDHEVAWRSRADADLMAAERRFAAVRESCVAVGTIEGAAAQIREALAEALAELAEKIRGGTVQGPEASGDFVRDRMLGVFDSAVSDAVDEVLSVGVLDGESARSLPKFIEDARTAQRRARDRLLANIRSLLSDAQVDRWPAFERAVVRRNSIPRGRLGGESLDLVARLGGISAADDDVIADMLERYEIELHRVLVDRDDHLHISGPRLHEALLDADWSVVERILERRIRMRVVVCELNRRFGEEIMAAADPEDRDRLRVLVSFPPHARLGPWNRLADLFGEAMEIEGLDPGLVRSISDLRARHAMERDAVDRMLVEAVRRAETSILLSTELAMLASLFGGLASCDAHARDVDRVDDLLTQRRRIDDRYLARLRSMLGDAWSFDASISDRPEREAIDFLMGHALDTRHQGAFTWLEAWRRGRRLPD